ncbi:hypothetical protein NHX12_011819, partial [Muraenolepis orangiensis]
MEKDFQSAPKRFWQTIRRLRRGKRGSIQAVYNALYQVSEKLEGPFNLEVAAEYISVKVSEAIMHMQENSVGISTKVTELKERLWPMRGFWLSLPHTICNDDKMAADVTNDDRCWNGQT